MSAHLRDQPWPLPVLSCLALALGACGRGEPEGQPAPGTEESAAPGLGSGTPRVAPAAGETPNPAGAAPSGLQSPNPLLFEARERPEPAWKLDNVARRDPGVDGWETEVLHDRAKAALKGFLHAWVHPPDDRNDEDHGDALGTYVSTHFEGASSLRPLPLEPMFDDGTTRVLRPASIEVEAPLRPAAKLEALLAEALAPFETAAGELAMDVDVDFKLVKVDGNWPLFEVTSLLELDGRFDQGAVQQNSTWRVGFEVGTDDTVLLTSIRLLAYEEVHTNRRLLSEHTRHVFGGHPFWDQEFRLGVGDYYNRQDKLAGNAFVGAQGLAVGDLNGDGLDDVYACQQGGLPNRLFLHAADGTTTEVASEVGLDILDNTRAALIVDLDGDGLQDVAMAVRQNVLLFFNQGGGRSFEAGILHGRNAEDIYSLSAADPDLDGDLDLYACRYVKGGLLGGVPTPYHDADNGSMNQFWRNLGGREFEEATRDAGLMQNNTKFSLAAIWEDFDLDGRIDLYVSNDFGRNNYYANLHPRKFRDQAAERGADDMAAGMGASSADIDLDGWPDLLVTNMFSSPGLRIASRSEQFMDGEHTEVHGHYVRHARGNTLLCNRGDGTFEDISEAAGVAMGRWGWGALFVDLNNDGYEDIYAPNGFITNQDPEDM